MSALASAVSLLHAATSSVAGDFIIFQRGTCSFRMLATFGRSKFEVDDTAGGRIEVESHDFLVLTAELRLPDYSMPKEGDRVLHTVGNVTSIYELMTPPYSPSDSTGARLRLHTKQLQ